MTRRSSSSNSQFSNASSDPLVERVRARVGRATRVIKRRDRAALPPNGRARTPDDAPAYELRALRLVYHSLGRAYRRHRDQTGAPVTPALKAAAKAFKQDPTVLSLAPVAAYLDQMGLLTW